MASSLSSPSLPRQLLRYVSSRLGGLLVYPSPSPPNHPKHIATTATAAYQQEQHGNINSAAAANVRVVDESEARNPPREGDGGKTNASPASRPRGGEGRGPAPPAGGPREGTGGRGGVIHEAAASKPQGPGAPPEGTGGHGGAINDASS